MAIKERFQAGTRKNSSPTVGRATGRSCTSEGHRVVRLRFSEGIFLGFGSHGSSEDEEADSGDTGRKDRLFQRARFGAGRDDFRFSFLTLLEFGFGPGLPFLDLPSMDVSFGFGGWFFFA